MNRIALTLLCFIASSANADLAVNVHPQFKLRLYESQAVYLVKNLTASQLHKQATPFASMEVYLLSVNGPAPMQQRMGELTALGIHSIPGQLLFTADTSGNPLDPKLWQAKAAELAAVAALRIVGDRRVYIDAENYQHPQDPWPTDKAALAAAMMPYVSVIRANGIVPCLTPAFVNDPIIEAIVGAADSSEHMDEQTFYTDQQPTAQATLDALKFYGAKRQGLLAKYPNAKCTPGLLERSMRTWDRDFMATTAPALGEADCWVFLYERSDEQAIGTAAWLTGASLNPLNDVAHVFPLSALGGQLPSVTSKAILEDWCIDPTGAEVTAGHLPPRPRDPVMDGAYWVTGQRFLRDSTKTLCRPTGPFAISVDAYLPTSPVTPANLFGPWSGDPRFSSYQVRFDGSGNWVLDTCDGKTITRAVASVPAVPGWNRIALSFDGKALTLASGANAATKAATMSQAPNLPLSLGLGELDGKRLFAEGVRLKNVSMWGRALTAAETKTVAGGAVFPFGK